MRGRKRILVTVGIIAVFGVLYMFKSGDETTDKNQYFIVKRGNFSVSITEGGSLRAVNEVVIRSEVEGTPRIIKLVPEGTVVKQGDLLVELDSADLRDRMQGQQLQVEQAQFSYDASVQDLSIQKSLHDSNMKEAELKVLFADSDLEKYEQGDMLQLIKTATNAVIIAQEELAQARDRRDWTEKLLKQEFATKSEFDKDDLAMKRAAIALEKSRTEFDLLQRYDIPKKRLQLKANLDSAKKELERIKHRGEALIAQQEQTVNSRQRALELQKEKLAEITRQLALTKIVAPQAGMVVYPFSDRYSSSSAMIEEGAQVRQRQELIKLPDTSQMLVEIKVHESYVNQIKPGLPANVTIDSIPDASYDAVVRKVAVLPDTQSRYSNPNLKVYSTEVLITDVLPDIKPGVSARGEIIITNLMGVITVPIQAVTTLKGKQVCYVSAGFGDPSPIQVEVGMFNDRFIEIRSGLREGDKVLLTPPLNTESGNDEAALEKNLSKKPRELKPEELPATSKGAAQGGYGGLPGQRERSSDSGGSNAERKSKKSSEERPARPAKSPGT